jgi:hypothetical protein
MKRRHHLRLEHEHLAVVGLVVEAAQVQHAVHDRLDQVVRVLGADDHVAKLARSGDRPGLVDWERQHVGRAVLAAVLAIELADALLVDQLDRQVAVADADGRERRLGGVPEARLVCLDLDQREARRRSSEVWRAECSS